MNKNYLLAMLVLSLCSSEFAHAAKKKKAKADEIADLINSLPETSNKYYRPPYNKYEGPGRNIVAKPKQVAPKDEIGDLINSLPGPTTDKPNAPEKKDPIGDLIGNLPPSPVKPVPEKTIPVKPAPVQPAPVKPVPAPVKPAPAPVKPVVVAPIVKPTPAPVKPAPVKPTPVTPAPVVPPPPKKPEPTPAPAPAPVKKPEPTPAPVKKPEPTPAPVKKPPVVKPPVEKKPEPVPAPVVPPPKPPVTKPEATGPLGVPAWGDSDSRQSWTRAVREIVENRLADFEKARDKAEFCPGYEKATHAQKVNCFVLLVAAVSKYESAFKADTEFREPDGNYSVGLLALSPGECPNATSHKALESAIPNLICGTNLMARLIAKDGNIDGPDPKRGAARYWSTLRTPYKRYDKSRKKYLTLGKRNEIEPYVRGYRGAKVVKPVSADVVGNSVFSGTDGSQEPQGTQGLPLSSDQDADEGREEHKIRINMANDRGFYEPRDIR